MDTITRTPVRRRAALFIDLENIVHPERLAGDGAAAVSRVAALLGQVRAEAELVQCVAVCDAWLAQQLGPELHALGVRVFRHRGGADEADRQLIARLEHDVADSCTMLVIASGDHAFSEIATAHRGRGRRVQVIARTGSIAADLYRVVDDFIHLDDVCIDPACAESASPARSAVA